MSNGLARFLGGRAPLVLLSTVAIAERTAWAWKRGTGTGAGEANQVALALASGRGFADPYFYGSGPTAHLMPTTPLLAGGVYAALGPGSVAAEVALQMLACLEMVAGYLLLFTLMGRIGVPRPSRLAALAILCLIPVFMGQESLDFRYWEGGLAVVLALATLHVIIGHDRASGRPTLGQQAGFAALLALTFFVSPVLGMGLALCSVVLALRRWAWPERIRTGAITCILLTALLAPWVIRNQQVLDKPILLRSNAGLEMAIANNDVSLGPDHKLAFNTSMAALHPAVGPAAAARVRQIGEIAYMAEMSRQVSDWVARHPDGFVRLAGRHIRQMIVAEPFQFEIGSGSFSQGRALIYSVAAIAGLIGIAWGIASGRQGYGYVAIVIATVILSYAPFQPMARYLYLIYGMLMFLAFDAFGRVIGVLRLAHGRAPARSMAGSAA